MSGKDANHLSPNGGLMDRQYEDGNSDIPRTPDRVKFSSETTSYSNSDHWTSILDGISELREHLDHAPSSLEAKDEGCEDIAGPELLFGRQRYASKEEILAALPPRPEADQLIDIFFATMETHTTFLHKPTYYNQYHRFWLNPFETSTMWIALLYASLALGARFHASIEEQRMGDANSGPESGHSLYSARTNFYREKAVQCMILANYTKCPPFTIEAFLLYFGTEFLRSVDAQFSAYLIVAMLIRMCFRMGYHRDPSRFPNISPFEGEMRRRKWLVVMTLDLVTSAQLGLPRMIQPFMFDTQEPRNLAEGDIYEDMTGPVPPSKPESELTSLLYFILLSRLRNIQAQIIDMMNATSQPPYANITDIDTALRYIHDNAPHSPDVKDIVDVSIPMTLQSMRQCQIDLAFLKAEVMLHRPYLKLGRVDKHYEYSRRVCLNASMRMLSFQCKMHAVYQPEDKMFSSGWRVSAMSSLLTPVVVQDFLLATTVLVIDLDEDSTSPLPDSPSEPATGVSQLDKPPPTREEIVAALRSAYGLWLKASKKSQEARKVATAVKLVLSRVGGNEMQEASPATSSSNTVVMEQDRVHPSPAFDFNEYGAPQPAPNVSSMSNAGPQPPFAYEQMPMDLETLNIPFDWVSML
ncbi:uncharacterized protein SETTUDRAFT_134212 [Exserohilum turcica Et28A]|uniref:Xylanolytic transcriptional activator regulatory domain-containing protein n=1 Tax=Exserohilum turcicum (strain 28A) TaxID=671987 RepID=R0KH12_EXST2|nr:uncharacterized protein SETTUDRAFT_134212 [Exserohilum turcica Et28A]EOA92133.1 hypothetical protein SETTUDRAFT_134212 [Exserohilum turcica Et28A]